MIAAAHQPHFLPWLGYLNKVVSADVFIWLDTVQYRKNYFQNRTRIMGSDGQPQWLTLPVHARSTSRILDVTIAGDRWVETVERTLVQRYGKAPYFDESWPALQSAMRIGSDRLADVNLSLFRATLALLGHADARLVVASEQSCDAPDPSDRLVALCRRVGADRYIAGRGGRGYMRLEAFDAGGIGVVWQEFDVMRTAYTNAAGERVEGLSVVDSLFQLGAARTAELTRVAWRPPSP